MEREDEDRVERLMATANPASAFGSGRFKQFLDHVPVAIVVSELLPSETIIYANFEFERLTGHPIARVEGRSLRELPGVAAADNDDRLLSEAIHQEEEYAGTFRIDQGDVTADVDAWSNTIEDDKGTAVFRLIALVYVDHHLSDDDDLRQGLKDKDTMLRELQHRVKNNLQFITTLIRLEARHATDDYTEKSFGRLAGRINALALLYDLLSHDGEEDRIDLGVYLSQAASSVMQAHASEGVGFDLKVDTWLVSTNVAMSAGLLVNELLTNSFKHAFVGREGGTITVHCLIEEAGYRIVVADDGVGFRENVTWPQSGKLGAAIAETLRQNAKADIEVMSSPNLGVRVTLFFDRAATAAENLPVS